MDIRPRASLVSRGYEYKTETQSQSYVSTTSTTNNRVGLNWIDKSVRAKRPRISNEDRIPESSNSQNESEDPTTSKPSIGNNSGILQRVTNTVSGLFNGSWSEWLKSPSVSTLANETPEVYPGGSDEFEDSNDYTETKDNQSFNLLYPEEGVTNFSDSGSELRRSKNIEEPNENPSFLIHSEQQPFKKNLSFVSSTPTLSPSTYKKRGNEDYLCESIISKPSTSNYKNEIITPREDSITLLKKTFPEPRPEPIYQNDSISTFPSSRKRLRDNIEDTTENIIGQNKSTERHLESLQLLTEQTEATNNSIKRKRPRFSISTYGSPLYRKQQEKEDEEPSFSIFYPGKIMYGGASNHQKKKNRIIPRKICPRTPIMSTNMEDDYSDGGLSSAARRILNCIDKISTPLSDSKRALPFTSMRDHVFNSSTFVADFHKNRPTLKSTCEITTPPTTKLLTPSKVKISKNFSSLFEPKDNNRVKETSTTRENSQKNIKKHSTSAIATNLLPPPPPQSIPIPSFSSSNSQPVSSVFPKKSSITENPVINISTNNKPFELKDKILKVKSTQSNNRSQDMNKSENVSRQFTSNKSTATAEKNPAQNVPSGGDISFSFSEPMILSEKSEVESILLSNTEFKFSLPINETRSSSGKSFTHSSGNETNLKDSLTWGNKFQIPNNMWDCEVCLLQNESSKLKCVACESPKPTSAVSGTTESKPATNTTNSFGNWGDKFKAPKGSWECEACLIQNKEEADKCVACLTAKSKEEDKKIVNSTFQPFSSIWGGSLKQSSSSSFENIKPSETTTNTTKEYPSTWGDAFKPSQGSWECAICLIENKSEALNCVACQFEKPKSSSKTVLQASKSSINQSFDFGEKSKQDNDKNASEEKLKNFLKKSENAWLCLICEGTNKADYDNCASCKSAKPVLNSNISPNCSRNSFGGNFGTEFIKNNNEWECETCLVSNKPNLQKCACCETPRVQRNHSTLVSEAITGNFKFGVPKASQKIGLGLPLVSTKDGQNKTFSPTVPTLNSSKFVFSTASPLSTEVPKSNALIPTSATIGIKPKPNPEPENKSLFDIKTPVAPPSTEDKPKPLFQFGSASLPATTKSSVTKLEFPKIGNVTSSGSEKSDLFSQPFPKVNPTSFNFFGGEKNSPSIAPFNPPPNKEATTLPRLVPISNTQSLTFAFGQQNAKPLSTGFNFGQANQTKPGGFTFGGAASTPILKFGQQTSSVTTPAPSLQTNPKDTGPPSFLNIEIPKPNPFSASGASNQQKRIIRRAVRKHK